MTNIKKLSKFIVLPAILILFFAGSLSALAVGTVATGLEPVSNKTAFLETILHHMLSRDTSFYVYYEGELADVYTDFPSLMNEVYASESGSGCGDYLEYTISKLSVVMSYTAQSDILPFHFTCEYLTTAQEEQYIDSQISLILDALQVYDVGDYEKVRTVYDYICTHFSYDYSLTKHSAYDALSTGEMVCQDYALLFYKMLSELNVPVRIISGSSQGGAHAWNIVKIGSYWYNVDTTWDSACSFNGSSSHLFFLKGSTDFPDHSRDSKYCTAEFSLQHPLSSYSFSSVESVLLGSLPTGEDTLLSPGDSWQLTATLYPLSKADTGVVWSSSDESVATVSLDGVVTAVSGGICVITATAADSGGAAAAFSFTVVDFSKGSVWAQDGLTLLYARGIIPTSLLVSFDAGITRGEFTALLMNYYAYAGGQMGTISETAFSDIDGHPFQVEIELAFSLGIINGRSASIFAPNDLLTRQEGAKLLCTLLAALDNGTALNQFPLLPYADSNQIADWAIPYVALAYEKGIMHGSGLNFLPSASLTREQAMLLVERLAESATSEVPSASETAA